MRGRGWQRGQADRLAAGADRAGRHDRARSAYVGDARRLLDLVVHGGDGDLGVLDVGGVGDDAISAPSPACSLPCFSHSPVATWESGPGRVKSFSQAEPAAPESGVVAAGTVTQSTLVAQR
ncbi:hypothetical protein [Streptomyces sp. B3I8]|uniref:hypothetical protein n=1 Tax=Streptomyces sp. B3I8 TaxID=3042303 RepID=UPI0027D8D39B|nr:hypothetical protein [Streptomyces sp. B3I8]